MGKRSSMIGSVIIGWILYQVLFVQMMLGQSVQRDEHAVSVITDTVNAGGGLAVFGSLADFKASGEITYFWAGEEVQGAATIRARGTDQFRLDAKLHDGIRSFVVNKGVGYVLRGNGQPSALPPHNTANFGSLTLPTVHLAAALQDHSVSVLYVGHENKDGHQVHHLRLQKVFPNDVDGIRGRLTEREFYIDTVTLQIVSTVDMLHPQYQFGVAYPHEVLFSDYRTVGGLTVPFSIVEIANGQRTFAIRLNEFTINQGLSNDDFELSQ